MARSKRLREKQIQAWFDPADPNEQAFLELVDRFKKAGWSQKQIIFWGVRALAEQEGMELPPMEDVNTLVRTAFTELTSKIESLKKIIESGSFTSANQQAAKDLHNDIKVKLDAVQASMAGRYKAMSYDDEEDI